MTSKVPESALDMATVDGVAVVKLSESKLDDSNSQAVGEQLLRLADDMGQHQLLHLDFNDVRYVGSMGLAKLVALHKKLKNGGRQLTLYNVNSLVYEVFQATRLNTLLDIRRKDVA